jgi:arylsulfatase A-like enzyme
MKVDRPNILYIHSHDTGRHIQPYGHAAPTPRLQHLAEEGVFFRQAFSVAPTCSPSRACLLTGQVAHNNGMLGLAHRGFSLDDYDRHLVHTLRDAGYHTALVGVQHVARRSEVIGYDQLFAQGSMAGHRHPHPSQKDQNAPSAAEVVAGAAEFLHNAPAQPFFLSVGFYETHREYQPATPDDNPNYVRPPAHLPDTPETRRDMADFHASARLLDRSVGAVLDLLDAEGLAENTLVIATTDHGLAMPGMKCTLYDRGIGVLLIMRGPRGFSGGRVIDAMVSHLDIFPTLCDYLDIDPPDWLQGRSIMPLIRGETDAINDAVFAEVNYHAAYEPQRAVRTRRWKYIRRFDGRERPVLPNVDDSLSKDVWLAHGWRERPVPAEELYDLVFDPGETHNLAGDPRAQEALDAMRARLDRWMAETDDPLLRGPVAAPPGAVYNDPDGLSPGEPTLRAG